MNAFALLRLREWVHAELWAVSMKHDLVLWWNGSATFQLANPLLAIKESASGTCPLTIYAAWQDTANHRDKDTAMESIVEMLSTRFENWPWNDEAAMRSFDPEDTFGDAWLMPSYVKTELGIPR